MLLKQLCCSILFRERQSKMSYDESDVDDIFTCSLLHCINYYIVVEFAISIVQLVS